jgi:hypothetical protein
MARTRKNENTHDEAAQTSRNGAAAEQHARDHRGGGLFRLLLLLIVAGVLALIFNEGLRSKVLDMLFGAEEEFDYSSTTMPATDAPSAVGASPA